MRLPEYMKCFYLYLLKTFDLIEEELGTSNSYRVFYLKELASIYAIKLVSLLNMCDLYTLSS